MKIHNSVVPVNIIIERLEFLREELRQEQRRTSYWNFKRQWILSGGIAAYTHEIEQILEITSKWQPFWKELGVKEK